MAGELDGLNQSQELSPETSQTGLESTFTAGKDSEEAYEDPVAKLTTIEFEGDLKGKLPKFL